MSDWLIPLILMVIKSLVLMVVLENSNVLPSHERYKIVDGKIAFSGTETPNASRTRMTTSRRTIPELRNLGWEAYSTMGVSQ